jgi:hypothetical protein
MTYINKRSKLFFFYFLKCKGYTVPLIGPVNIVIIFPIEKSQHEFLFSNFSGARIFFFLFPLLDFFFFFCPPPPPPPHHFSNGPPLKRFDEFLGCLVFITYS